MSISGKKFGNLTVLNNIHNTDIFWVRCDCGKGSYAKYNDLLTGKKQMCEYCARDKNIIVSKMRTRFTNIKQRCNNPNNPGFQDYGGRGIRCEFRTFEDFYDCVSVLPHFNEKGYSIDRIDNDGNYAVGNLRWATIMEQIHNQRPHKNWNTAKREYVNPVSESEE